MGVSYVGSSSFKELALLPQFFHGGLIIQVVCLILTSVALTSIDQALEAMGESVSEMKVVNLRPYITAVEVAALDLQKELQEKAMSLIIPSAEADRYSFCYAQIEHFVVTHL